MNRTLLHKAIALAVAGAALTAASIDTASAHVMYNSYRTADDPANTGGTDGWTQGFQNSTPATPNLWYGTTNGERPFGYIGSSHLNWAAELHSFGQSLVVSSQDALDDYGFAAEIDTGGGAWIDNSNPNTGWRHQTDIGLIKSDVDQYIRLNLTTTNGLYSEFGVTVFKGMDTNTGAYSHHGAWNRPGSTPPIPFTADNPFGTTGLTNIGWSDFVNSERQFVFRAEAGQIYSIYLGGAHFSRWNTGVADYALSITTSAVPEPGTLALFSGALAGMGWMRRRQTLKAAS